MLSTQGRIVLTQSSPNSYTHGSERNRLLEALGGTQRGVCVVGSWLEGGRICLVAPTDAASAAVCFSGVGDRERDRRSVGILQRELLFTRNFTNTYPRLKSRG